MALQNIGAGNSEDAFYRYKMPRMVTKIEGRGNGIKTNVVNMVDIAKALARPASYTTKYFGCELGAQSKFDEKTGTSHVNGAHDTSKLAGLLENFIKKYVQCYGCGNPETEILITKNQMIQLKCAACGFVSDVDMRDKLTTFIVKNPPEVKKGSKDKKAMRRAEKERLKEGEAADEEMKKVKKEVKKKGSSSAKDGTAKSTISKRKGSGSDEDRRSPTHKQIEEKEEAQDEDDDDDGVQWLTDTSLDASRQRIKEQLSAVTADMVMLSTDEPVKKKKAANNENGGSQNGNSKNYGTVVAEVKANLKKGVGASELLSHLAALPVPAQEKMNALVEALFEGTEKGFGRETLKKKNYFAAAVAEEGSQILLLHAIEEFSCKSNSNALKEVALVLKTLYDADVLEEEAIVLWYQKGLKGDNKNSKIWKNAQPFIDWLQNAESESDEEVTGSLVSFTNSEERAAPSNHFLLFRFAPIPLALRSLQQFLQESCKFCCSRFQGEGVTLKFLSCLNGLLSISEQLSCLESVFRLLGKRTGWCRGGSAACIVRLTRNTLSFVVAVCSPQFLKEGLCDNNLLINTIIASALTLNFSIFHL